MGIYELIDKLCNTLNELENESYLSVKNKLLKEILETLKILENCVGCKDLDKLHKSINEIENRLTMLEEEEEERSFTTYKLNRLFRINIKLNNEILCESCKEKKIEKLTDKCGNEEIAKFLYYQCKLNPYDVYDLEYIRWI